MTTTTELRRFMRANVDEFIDRRTNEVNATGLAEMTAEHFDLYEDRRDYTIPDAIFDLAADVALGHESLLKAARSSR